MSNSFGKRRADPLPPPPPPPRDKGSNGGSRRPLRAGAAPDLQKLAMIALFTTVAVAAIVGLNLGGRKALHSSLEARFDEAMSRPDVGLAPTAAFLFASTEDGSPALASLHAACRRASNNASIDSRFRGAPDASPKAGEAGLLRSAVFIACMMETEAARYCQKEHRADLVSQVREHLDVMRRVKGDWRFQSMPVDFTPGQTANPVLQAWKIKQTPLDVPERADYPSGTLDKRIVDGLRRLAEQGLISASDFGWFGYALPEELKPAFQNLELKDDPCT